MAQYTYDHIHLISPDPLKAVEFYERMFNAKRVAVAEMPGGGARVDLNLGGSRLLIRTPRDASQTVEDNPQGRRGLEHFGLVTNDIDAAVADLKKKGVKFIQVKGAPPGASPIFLMGPDNVMIELQKKP